MNWAASDREVADVGVSGNINATGHAGRAIVIANDHGNADGLRVAARLGNGIGHWTIGIAATAQQHPRQRSRNAGGYTVTWLADGYG